MSEPAVDGAPGGPAAAPGQNAAGASARLDAWRATGAHRVDPVRFGFIEALARRAAVQQGLARRILDAKLNALLTAYAEAVERRQSTAAKTPPPSHATQAERATAPATPPLPAREATEPRPLARRQATVARPSPASPRQPPPAGAQALRCATPLPPPRRGALAELIDEVDRRHTAADHGGDNAHAAATAHGLPPSRPVELRAVNEFKATWSRLSADRRLNQSLMAKAPNNAGPLNSQHLVHRSLLLMRELSPAYLRQFMAYADALAWIEDVQDAGSSAPASMQSPPPAAATAPASRRQEGSGGKKPARGEKSG